MAPSAVKSTSANHFEAVYEAPWGGVSSENYATDIDAHQFVEATGVALRVGNITSEYWDPYNSLINWASLPANSFVYGVVVINKILCVFDQYGNSYINSTGAGNFTKDQTVTPSWYGIDCIQVINGIAYLFDFGGGQSFAYTPNVSLVLNSSYVGGKYCCVVDGYLLTANSNQPSDNPAQKTGRVNWSSPYQFGIWDASVSRDAGYNVLADIQDEITGVFAIANVAFVLRTNGMTQLTPTGVATQPFDFPTMLSGDFASGCTFPKTLSVYGAFAIFGDETDFYLFDGSAPQGFCGAARDAIYTDINKLYNPFAFEPIASEVSGCLHNAPYNGVTPELCYTIAIRQVVQNIPGQPSNVMLIFWTYNMKRKTWVRNSFDFGGYVDSVYRTESARAIVGSTNLASILHVKYPNVFTSAAPAFAFPIFLYPCSVNVTGGFSGDVNFVLNLFQNLNGANTFSTNLLTPLPSGTIVFKQEEVKLGRKPTIIRVVMRACGVGTVNVTVANITFTPIVLNNSSFQTYTSSGVYTGEVPQLTLSWTNFYGTINKVMMTGTYADGDYN